MFIFHLKKFYISLMETLKHIEKILKDVKDIKIIIKNSQQAKQ